MKAVFGFLKRFGLDGFIIALLCMILLAWLFPQGGIAHKNFSLPAIANAGISLIFFFYGLNLSPAKLKAGLGNWKLPIVIHGVTFVLFPLLLLCFKQLFLGTEFYTLWLGTYFLACLPSTVSSSVVMVSIAEGNIPSAIFNASISSIFGVFFTPIWMQLVITKSQDAGVSLNDIILKLFLQVLVPVIIGLLLNKKFGGWAERKRKQLKKLDQLTILLIVYTAFCTSFEEHMFSNIGLLQLVALAMCMVALFFTVFFIITFISKLLHFSRGDTITAVFCGSKKSLVHGTVMVKVLFANSSLTGILLLPLMMYHALQLIISSMIAQRWAASCHKAIEEEKKANNNEGVLM